MFRYDGARLKNTMKIHRGLSIVVALVLATGAGSVVYLADRPAPHATLAEQQVLGEWTYGSTSPAASVVVYLRGDHTLRQIVRRPGKPDLIASGTWRLVHQGQYVFLIDLWVYEDDWRMGSTSWISRADRSEPGGFRLLGGVINDPDDFGALGHNGQP
jgi:hypothetical protein